MSVPTRRLVDKEGADALGEVQEQPTEYTLLARFRALEEPQRTYALLEEILLTLRALHRGMEAYVWQEEIPIGEE